VGGVLTEYTSPKLLRRPAGLFTTTGLFVTDDSPPPPPSEAVDDDAGRGEGWVNAHFLFRQPAPHRHFFLFVAFLVGVGGGDDGDSPLVATAGGAGGGTTVHLGLLPSPELGEEAAAPAADG